MNATPVRSLQALLLVLINFIVFLEILASSSMFQLFWKAIARLEYVGITCRLRHPELTIHDLPDEMHEIEARCTDCNLSMTHLIAL